MQQPILPSKVDAKNWRMYDPFLRPEWRWERVLRLLDGSGGVKSRCGRGDDDFIRGAKSFLANWRAAKDEAMRTRVIRDNLGMYWAYSIYDREGMEPDVAFMVEMFLLAGKPAEEIAFSLNLHQAAVEWYEAIYFNVLPRLKRFGWIVKHALMPAADRLVIPELDEDDDGPKRALPIIKPHWDFTAKLFAYFGGPVMADFMLTGFRQGVLCHSQEEIAEWLNGQWMHQFSRRSAQAAGMFQIDKWSVELLFMTHARIIELQKGTQGADEKRTMIEKHIGAMLGELPWVHGELAKEAFKGSDLERYDGLAAELRDTEVQFLAAGDNPKHLEELPLLNISRTGKEAKPDANSK